MKKIIAILIISGNIFGMRPESMPDNKIKEIQGAYNPTIGFFNSKKINPNWENILNHEQSHKIKIIKKEDTLKKPTKKNKPEYKLRPLIGEMSADRPKKNTISSKPMCVGPKKISVYEETRIMSYGFNTPYTTSVANIFESLKNSPEMLGFFMTNFQRINEEEWIKKENGDITIQWIPKNNIRCPFVIIEYVYNR